jgi:hypothetical protein
MESPINRGRADPSFEGINLIRQLEGQEPREPKFDHFNPHSLMHYFNRHLGIGKKPQLVTTAAVGIRNKAVSFPSLLRVLAKGRTAALANRFFCSQDESPFFGKTAEKDRGLFYASKRLFVFRT